MPAKKKRKFDDDGYGYITVYQPVSGYWYSIEPADDSLEVLISNDFEDDLEVTILEIRNGVIGNPDSQATFEAESIDMKEMAVGTLPATSGGSLNRYFSAYNDDYNSGFSFGVYEYSDPQDLRPEFFGADQPVIVSLVLQLDVTRAAAFGAACDMLCRPTPLIYSQDRNFPWCWFSRPIDISPESGNPAFWMLKWTPPDTWTLYLRRFSGDLATYFMKTRKKGVFPLRLALSRRNSREYDKWPKIVTINPA